MSIPTPARIRRPLLQLAGLAGALAAAALSGQASAQPYNQGGPSSDVGQICHSVVGAAPGEAHYVGCVQALIETEKAFGPARTPGLRPVAAADPRGASKSYFQASPGEIRHRVETSCVELGLDPGSRGFAACLVSLQSALFAADNPLN